MAKPKRKKWRCSVCYVAILAPSRMLLDDARRYCLTCTASTGRLVRRELGLASRRGVRCSEIRANIWHEPAQCTHDAGHEGDHEAIVVVVDGWPETGQTRRIAWDERGHGRANEVISTKEKV